MKAFPFPRALVAAVALLTLWQAGGAVAASLSITVTRFDAVKPDAAYPGMDSNVTTATDKKTGITASVAGRNYGVVENGPQWGIQSGSLPWNDAQSGFIVTNGFGPSAPGSKTTAAGHAASFVTIALGNVQPNTLFQNVSIDFSGLVFTRNTNAWVAASPGGFTSWVQAVQNGNGNGRRLSANLPDFTWFGDSPLEIRLYGLTGLDEGSFSTVKVTANLSPGAPVPEPGVLVLLCIWLLATYTGRYR